MCGAAVVVDYSEPKCDEPHEYSIAQMIKLWLKAWDLTLVTAEP